MSKEYVIFTDVSTDVDKEFAKEHDIRFIAMSYTLGEENRHCDNIEQEDVLKRFYDGQRNGDLTQTSQINPQNYRDCFEPVIKEGKSILYLSLSSGLSGTFQSANIAADELMDEYEDVQIIPVDTLSATGGMGLLVEAAALNRDKGMSLEDNADWLNANRSKVRHWFMVEDLMYLKRGGRVSAAAAIVGTTLNIKPVLMINKEGRLVTIDKKRGTKAAMKCLLDDYLMSMDVQDVDYCDRIYIAHADCAENADFVEQALLKMNPDLKITKMMLSPIIGAHTGPGMLAIIHWGAEREE